MRLPKVDACIFFIFILLVESLDRLIQQRSKLNFVVKLISEGERNTKVTFVDLLRVI